MNVETKQEMQIRFKQYHRLCHRNASRASLFKDIYISGENCYDKRADLCRLTTG